MPLLPNNIPISDSGFENVNAFNTVTPHSHQTGENSRTGEARTYSVYTNMHRGRDRETRTCKDTHRNMETDRYMLTYEPEKTEGGELFEILWYYLIIYTV